MCIAHFHSTPAFVASTVSTFVDHFLSTVPIFLAHFPGTVPPMYCFWICIAHFHSILAYSAATVSTFVAHFLSTVPIFLFHIPGTVPPVYSCECAYSSLFVRHCVNVCSSHFPSTVPIFLARTPDTVSPLYNCVYMCLAHSPDNSFMGFVVERHIKTSTLNGTSSTGSNVVRKNQAVVYGKAEYMWSVSSNWCYYHMIYGRYLVDIVCLSIFVTEWMWSVSNILECFFDAACSYKAVFWCML